MVRNVIFMFLVLHGSSPTANICVRERGRLRRSQERVWTMKTVLRRRRKRVWLEVARTNSMVYAGCMSAVLILISMIVAIKAAAGIGQYLA